MQNCKLCKERVADKSNSHIIPKFMCKRLFEDTKPRHTISLSKDGRRAKIQDIPKEDYILCSFCEKRFEKLETYFSRVFLEINSLHSATRRYELKLVENREVLYCDDVNPSLFYLFLYSLIWRSSISLNIIFDTFKIDAAIEEEIRVFLNNNLKEIHSDLIDNAKNIETVPNYYLCLIKPKNKSRGIFTAYEYKQNSCANYTVDYALFFYTKEEDCLLEHKTFGNRQIETFKIFIGDDENWRTLNNLVVQKMINYK